MTSFDNNAVGALEFTVSWEQHGVSHEEWYLGRKFNAVNDIFPRGMRQALEGKREGDSVSFTYQPRMCIPRHKQSLVRTLPLDRLRKKTIQGNPIIPRLGRFYPQGHIDGLLDVYPDTLTPFRLTGLTDSTFTADCNHPLALVPVTIEAKIQYLEKRDTGTYGSLTHWREKTCDWGPGMQTMHEGLPTDFFIPDFFHQEESELAHFTPPPVDTKAMRNMQGLFGRHIAPGMRVLDFALGSAPQPEGVYDAAVCTFSIEYMADPIATLMQIKERLKSGAPVLIGFSSHYAPSHVIRGWTELHEFERMGLVLEYLRQVGLDHDARTVSMRNDWRDKDDPRFMETRGVSDPVFVVCGHKR